MAQRPAELTPYQSAQHRFGAELRSWRIRHRLSLDSLGRMVRFSGDLLAKVEKARRFPSRVLAEACDQALGAGGVLVQLWVAADGERASSLAKSRQHQVAVGHDEQDGADWERLTAVAARPRRVTAQVVDDLELITNGQRQLYHELPSALMSAHVETHLDLLVTLLGAPADDVCRARVASASAEAAGFAAWLHFDLGNVVTMADRYRLAEDTVVECGDDRLAAYISAYRGQAAAQVTGPEAALRYAAAAIERAPRNLSALTRSWIVAHYANALAGCGETTVAVMTLGRAVSLFEKAEPDQREPWMYEFDPSAMAALCGACYLALGQPNRAAQAIEEGLTELPAACTRRRASMGVDLARAWLAMDEVEEAHRVAGESLVIFAERGSKTGVHSIRRLRDALARAGCAALAEDLDERVRALLVGRGNPGPGGRNPGPGGGAG